ncbi:MAG: class I SAM-dependent methyltransferase [Pontiellaceae bacterium]|jgi:ubiquinone/menaquinone biosynthesis C-methylase UbiE|nr:class I SAM-dependent methyltransferase [Pontiellaceae bacterium]
MNSKNSEKLSRIYDGFADGYDRGRDAFDNTAQLHRLTEGLPEDGADILDAGCGSGYPVLRFFADRGHRVTGSDICPAMLALAARRVPEARLVQADTATLDFPDGSFDLITSFYSLFHLDMGAQERAFAGFFRMLRRDGTAYFTLASEQYTGRPVFNGTKEFAGVELPYSHVTPEAYRKMLEKAGFSIVETELLSIGGETMLWVFCKK